MGLPRARLLSDFNTSVCSRRAQKALLPINVNVCPIFSAFPCGMVTKNSNLQFFVANISSMRFSIINVVPNTGSIVLVPTPCSFEGLEFYLDDHQIYHILPIRAYQGLGSLSGPNTSLSHSSIGKCAFSICSCLQVFKAEPLLTSASLLQRVARRQ